MKPFTQHGAAHFVGAFGADAAVSTFGVQDYLDSLGGHASVFSEGTPRFGQLKDCLLRESERSLLLSASCYVRALDGLRESSAYWSVVGLYYASFFSVKAVLGMYGCWMGGPRRWIEVVDANPGVQKIAYRTGMYPNTNGQKGSHKVTWIAFYEAMNYLTAWLTSANAALATAPVNASRTWMIDTRNEVNYEPIEAFRMMTAFQGSFDPANLPTCFGGKLQTMLEMAKAFVLFAKEMAVVHALSTDVWLPAATRMNWCQLHLTAPQHPALTTFATSEYPQLEY